MDRVARHHGGARCERADRVGESARVTGDDLDVVERHAERVGDDLCEGGLMALSLRREPRRDLDLARGLHLDMATLVGTDARALDVGGHPDPEQPALARGHLPTLVEAVPVRELTQLREARREVSGVVDVGPAVLEGQPEVVGHLLGTDHVALTHGQPVDAEVASDAVHGPLHREAALRPPGPAVGADRHRVGVERLEADPVVGDAVRPQQLRRGDDRDDQAVRDVGAVVVQQVDVEPEDLPLVVEPDVDELDLPALMVRGDEVLTAVLGELHVVPEQSGRPRDEELLRPRVHDLDAEAAADVRRDALDLGERELEERRDHGAHARRGLRRRVHPHAQVVGVPARVHPTRLHRRRGRTIDVETEREAVGRGGDRSGRVTDRLGERGRDVVGDLLVHGVHGRDGDLVPDDGRQHLVGDLDACGRVLRDVTVSRDDHRDGLTDVVDLAVREHMLGAGGGQRRVRDEDRQPLLEPWREVLIGMDGDEAIDLERVGDVDVEDARMRMGAADDRDLVRVLTEVVEVATLTAQQAGVLTAQDGSAEHAGRHALRPSSGACRSRGSAPLSLRTSAACPTAARMPAYPVQRHRLPESPSRIVSPSASGSSASRLHAVRTNPGVQKPHCRP